jgi:hypothetical protein
MVFSGVFYIISRYFFYEKRAKKHARPSDWRRFRRKRRPRVARIHRKRRRMAQSSARIACAQSSPESCLNIAKTGFRRVKMGFLSDFNIGKVAFWGGSCLGF